MDALTTHMLSLAPGSEEALSFNEAIQGLLLEHKERGGFQHIHSTHDYIKYMRLDAKDGGLWMDNLSSAWLAHSLNANIETLCYIKSTHVAPSTLILMPYTPLPGPAPTYRLVHTRGPPGHYTPVYTLPSSPTRIATYPAVSRRTRTTNNHLPTAVREYWEQQDKCFCLLHAFNMIRRACMAQEEPISPHDIIHWFQLQRVTPRYPHHQRLLNDSNPESRCFDPELGNFNPCAFAYWAYLSEETRISSIHFPVRSSPALHADLLPDFLTQTLRELQTEKISTLNGFILTTREVAGYCHATTLLIIDEQWYWLDSDPTKSHRAILTAHTGAQNRAELLSVALELFAVDLGAQSLSDCPLACTLFHPDPPAPWHNQRHEVVILDSPPPRPRIIIQGARPQANPRMAVANPPQSPTSMQAVTTQGSPTTHQQVAAQPNAVEVQGTNRVVAPPNRTCPKSDDNKNPKRAPLPTRSTKNQADRTSSRQTAAQKDGKGGRARQSSDQERNAVPVQHTTSTKRQPKKQKKAGQQILITSLFSSLPLPHRKSQNDPPPSPPTPSSPKFTPASPAAPASERHFSMLQLNTQGSLWNMKEDLTSLLQTANPDIIGICDIGLTAKNKRNRWLAQALNGYQYWVATHTSSEGRAQRGVLIAVKNHLATLCNHKITETDSYEGRLLHLVLHPPHSQPLGISEAYLPAGNTKQDNMIRERIYNNINAIIRQGTSTTYHILAADWNATLLPSDRSSGLSYEKDYIHRAFVTNSNLRSTDMSTPRSHTYHHTEFDSRIDDILTNFPCQASAAVMDEGILSDHSPLLVKFYLRDLDLLIPHARLLPSPSPSRVVVRPISDSDKIAFQQAIQMYSTGQAGQIHALHQELKLIIDTIITPYFESISNDTGKTSNRLTSIHGMSPASAIEELSAKLLSISNESHKIMLETCTTKMTNPTGTHYRKRSVNRHRKRLSRCLQQLRNLHREVQQGKAGTVDDVTRILETTTKAKNMPTDEAYQRWTKALATNRQCEEPVDQASQILLSVQADLRKDIKNLDREHNRASFQQAINHNRHFIDTKPKQANRIMRQAAKGTHTNKYPALYDEMAKCPTDDPQRMNQIVTDYFTKTLSCPPQGKTGAYHPSATPDEYFPWEKGTDHFKLETHASRLANRPQLHTRIIDSTVFADCIRTLSNSKAPGPDGIDNELLKMMPMEFKECIHMLFIIMWAVGITPSSWKESHHPP